MNVSSVATTGVNVIRPVRCSHPCSAANTQPMCPEIAPNAAAAPTRRSHDVQLRSNRMRIMASSKRAAVTSKVATAPIKTWRTTTGAMGLTIIRRSVLHRARYFRLHRPFLFISRLLVFVALRGSMPRPKAHYSLILKNHRTGKRLKLDLVDLPFATSKSFRVRINGRWAKKLPVASKTAVMRQLRAWWVAH
jgi:hypothetical protein